jgi:hypothetical protein
MTNYVLGAHRFAEQSFIQPQDPTVWRQQSDWTTYFVIFPVLGVRSGAELLLSWVIVLTGLNGVLVYMTLLVALHVSLILAATALISTSHRYARFLAAVLLSSSAMLALGVAFQLLAQVLGLLLLTLGSVLCLAPMYRLSRLDLLKFVALAGITMGTLGLTYPEVFPFFGIAFLLYHAFAANEVRRFLFPALVTVLAVAIIAYFLIAPDAWHLITFLFRQAQVSQAEMALPKLFPYFLVPSGLAALWGLSPFVPVDSALLIVAIVVGAGLSVLAVAIAFRQLKNREAAASLAVTMMALVPFLFLAESGFGLLKLAMFAQPFILPTMAIAACRLLRAN